MDGFRTRSIQLEMDMDVDHCPHDPRVRGSFRSWNEDGLLQRDLRAGSSDCRRNAALTEPVSIF